MRDEEHVPGDSIQLMAASIWYKTSQRGLIFIIIIFNKQSTLLNDFKVCFIVCVWRGGGGGRISSTHIPQIVLMIE